MSLFKFYGFKLFNHHSLKSQHYKCINNFTQLPYFYKSFHPLFLFHSISKNNKLSNKSNSGSLFDLNCSSDSNKKSSNLYIIKEISKYLWPKNDLNTKIRVCLSLSLLVGSKVLNIQIPFFFKKIIDSINIDSLAINETAWTVTGSIVIGYGLARITATAFQEIRNSIFATVSQKATRKHLLRLDLNFHLTRKTGGLTKAIDHGTKSISFLLTSMVFHILPVSLEITMVCGVLTYQYGSHFALVTLATMILYTAATIKTTTWRTKFRKEATQADNAAATLAMDLYDKCLKHYESSSIKVASSLAFLNTEQNIIFSTAITAMMYLTVKGIYSGQLSIGDLVMINQLVFQLSVPLNFLGTVYRELKQSLIDMETMFNLQKIDITIKEDENAKNLDFQKGKIQFENVTFGYLPERPIFEDLSFTIYPGQKVAFVGPSGSGKSTILRLLFRFYDVQKGRILIDGQDIRHITLNSLRKCIGVLPQDTPFFNDTILNNIRYGKIDATIDEVIQAAKIAQIHDIIQKFPDKYNTKVGERGLMISGGEKQRLAISRLLLKNSPILFFDEATSALDSENEKSILNNIQYILKKNNKTGIFIAHKLRTIMDSDNIIVLENKKIVESGTHYELIKKQGFYNKLWISQKTND
ncbi:hypothetical protein PORY_002616 [Pneumocystis oryctolagi]|uniref:Uncharacterized protein n=1 Tax=Pneumocystis oryctolagi TaxID=42067 RepID=A0ACB7CAK5_9ASCO|nr:hypothetical protein PORY_002616 [Pneumocystis oryctolagi]